MADLHALKRVPSEKTIRRLHQMKSWHLQLTGGDFGNGQCRFCDRWAYQTKGVYKYGVRHYCCTDCRDIILTFPVRPEARHG